MNMAKHASNIATAAGGISPPGNSLDSTAADYLACGWSVIPLVEKRPALATWKEFQRRLPTSEEISFWFTDVRPAPTGVGVVTGKVSGLVVIDCDSPEHAAYWLSRFPASPLMTETGRGGLHVYYRQPVEAEIRNRVKIHRRQIDVRGEGGYVAAPPSLHSSGRRYRWTTPVADFSALLPYFDPSWLVDAAPPTAPSSADQQVRAVRYAAAYIRRIHATAGEAGHNATYRAACKLRDAGLSADEALALLVDWNETNAHPPWDEAELRHKIGSAFNGLTR